eukprot:2524050-Prymnesium_polylepis.1
MARLARRAGAGSRAPSRQPGLGGSTTAGVGGRSRPTVATAAKKNKKCPPWTPSATLLMHSPLRQRADLSAPPPRKANGQRGRWQGPRPQPCRGRHCGEPQQRAGGC